VPHRQFKAQTFAVESRTFIFDCPPKMSVALRLPSLAFWKDSALAYLSLLLLGLAWILPPLYYNHLNPIPAFYNEWIAAVLGTGALFWLILSRWNTVFQLPRIALLPLGLLLVLAIQLAVGKLPSMSQTTLNALYLLWIAGVMVLGQHLREKFGLEKLATLLAIFLLIGAELNALTGMSQHYAWRSIFMYITTAKIGPSLYGNMGQANHFADYLTLGLLSLCLLYVRHCLQAWVAILLSIPLLFSMVLSGSRGTWLYLLAATLLAFVWQRRDAMHKPLLRSCLAALLGFALMHIAVELPILAGASQTGSITTLQRLTAETSTQSTASAINAASSNHTATVATNDSPNVVQKLFAEGSSGRIRLRLWYESWLMLTQYPILGTGMGQYAWQHFQMLPQFRDTNVSNINNYAHNLILHTAAEMGVIGLIILLGTLLLWVRQARRATHSSTHWWGYALLMTMGIHALLEYPLAYTYFLVIAALVIGMLDDTHYRLKQGVAVRAGLSIGLLGGVLALVQMGQVYPKLAMLNLTIPPDSIRDGSYLQRVQLGRTEAHLRDLRQRYFMLRDYTEMTLGETDYDHLADNLALNERVLHFAPIPPVAFRQARLLAGSGQPAEARIAMERAIWSHPLQFAKFQAQLKTLADMDPDPTRFPALLQFANDTYEDRQHVLLHTK
jgi:O-antigen ligase